MRARLFLLLTILPVAASAQTLDQRIDRELPSLVETYKKLHAAPELSQYEAKSSALVASRLRELGYEVTERFGAYADPSITCYGVIAVMKNGAGPTVLVRSDMDALPVKEQTGLPYASTSDAMHACGHDIHMTTLLGTAKMLADLRSSWKGTVMLVGQPAEEVVRGAQALLNGGLYQKFPRPDFAVALHDSATLPAGTVGYTPGYTMSAGDSANLTVRGLGGHGASPEKTRDPVVIAAQIVLALQTIASRETSPLDPVVVTVGSIHGGTKRNIIPDEVQLLLTIRTYKPEVRERVLAAVPRIANGIALAAGLPESRLPVFEHLKNESIGATYNDPALTERLVKALEPVLGKQNVMRLDPLMVSEDFGLYSDDRKIPTCLLTLGAVDPALVASGVPLPSLHSSKFAPLPEPTLRTGVKTMTTVVLELLD